MRSAIARTSARTASISAPSLAATAFTPVGARYSPNTSRNAPAHSPTVPPALASAIVAGTRFSSCAATARSSSSARVDRGLVARGAPRRDRLDVLVLRPRDRWSRCRRAARSSASGDGSVSVNEFTPTTLQVARLDAPHALGVRLHEAALHLVDHRERAAARRAPTRARPPPLRTTPSTLRSTTTEPSNRSPYSSRSDSYASTCWMRSDHCWSHGVGRPERLVPARQLDRARPRVLRQRDAEHLEHDALHVVLGLLLGEAERVHLHAVAEAAQLLVVDAVALVPDAIPHARERAHLAHLFDEAHAGVDEERDAAEHFGELVVGNLARLLAPRRARRSRWRARTRAPAPASRPLPASGTGRR